MSRFLLRSAATLTLFAGLSALVAGLAAFGVLSADSAAHPIVTIVFQIAVLFVIGGATTLYLSRTRRAILPNERQTSEAAPPDIGGWLYLLAVALVALPVSMVLRLRPFLAEWQNVIALGVEAKFWEDAARGLGGVILLPIFVALTPPFLELVTMVGFILASTSLLTTFVSRSRTFPRFYVAWVVLLAVLVMASARGAAAGSIAGTVVERAVQRSSRGTEEAAEIMAFVVRYVSTVNSASSVLTWTLVGYLIWVPAMFLSRRIRTTFQR
jgi:Protein of unknown function (DUF2569)